MNIIINALSAKVGGGKTYLFNLLAIFNQLALGTDVKIFVFGYDDLQEFQSEHVVLIKNRFPTYHPVARLFWEVLVLPFWIRKLKADVLFCPGGMVNTWGVGRCKIVTMFRNMLPFDAASLQATQSWRLILKNFLLKSAMLRSMARADMVIFIADYPRRVVEKLIDVKRGVTIPHGISASFQVAELPMARPSLPFEGKFILYVSRFEFYKRHLELVQAYELLDPALRSQYRLLIVGAMDTPSGETVRQYIQDHHLSDQVCLLGDYPYVEMPALYKHASLFVFMSACENCPNILLEAMGGGVPILCSNYQPMPEFGARSVVFVNPDVPASIAAHMTQLLADPLLLQDYAQRAQSRAADFSWDTTARRTWHTLREMASS